MLKELIISKNILFSIHVVSLGWFLMELIDEQKDQLENYSKPGKPLWFLPFVFQEKIRTVSSNVELDVKTFDCRIPRIPKINPLKLSQQAKEVWFMMIKRLKRENMARLPSNSDE